MRYLDKTSVDDVDFKTYIIYPFMKMHFLIQQSIITVTVDILWKTFKYQDT